jgi:TldD protein
MEEIVERAIQKGAEFFDIRIIEKESTTVEYKDGKLHSVLSGHDGGAGLRTIVNGAWGFASTTDISNDSLRKALDKALETSIRIADKVLKKTALAEVEPVKERITWHPKKDPLSIPFETKLELIKDMHDVAKEPKGVHSVMTGCGDVREKMRVLNSEGTDLQGEFTRSFARTQVIAREGRNVVSFYDAAGATGGWEIFDKKDPIDFSRSAGESAVRILSSRGPPSGRLPLVADQDLAGVFAHEALGHASEADSVVRGASCLEGIMGEKIGSDLVTIIDDPTFEGGFGSFPFDSEGVMSQEKILVDRGVLNDYILNRETAHVLKMKPNGGARVENYNYLPLVRMSNTFVQQGGSPFEELLDGIKLGIYAKGSRGGQVSPAKGTFQFNASEAFLIENGEVTEPLKDVSFGGYTLEVLKNIDAVGNDFQLGRPGNCGKEQWVPVNSGGPHVRVKEVTIGGGS